MSWFKEYLPFYKRNLRVALPIVFAQIGGSIVQFADNFMVGQLGTVELAAVSFAGSIFVIGLVLATTLLQSITPLVGYRHVNHDREGEMSYLTNGLTVSVIVGVLVSMVLMILSMFLDNMGQEPEVSHTAKSYYYLIVFSLLPLMVFDALRLFMAGIGNTSVAMWVAIVANVVNIIFNYLLIYGKFGFPKLGIDGAGMATLLSRILMPLLLVCFMLWRHEWRGYLKNITKKFINIEKIIELCRVGFPISARAVMEVSVFAMSGVIVGWIGAAETAANQIATTVGNVTFMISLGISSATTIRVSHQFGRGDYPAVKKAAYASIHLLIVNNLTLGILMIIFRYDIASAFSNDQIVINIAATLLICSGLFQLSDGLQCVGIGILNGLTDVKYSAFVAFIAYYVVNMPVGYVLCFNFGLGPVGIWIGFILGLSIAAVLFHIRCHKLMRRMDEGKYCLTSDNK